MEGESQESDVVLVGAGLCCAAKSIVPSSWPSHAQPTVSPLLLVRHCCAIADEVQTRRPKLTASKQRALQCHTKVKMPLHPLHIDLNLHSSPLPLPSSPLLASSYSPLPTMALPSATLSFPSTSISTLHDHLQTTSKSIMYLPRLRPPRSRSQRLLLPNLPRHRNHRPLEQSRPGQTRHPRSLRRRPRPRLALLRRAKATSTGS